MMCETNDLSIVRERVQPDKPNSMPARMTATRHLMVGGLRPIFILGIRPSLLKEHFSRLSPQQRTRQAGGAAAAVDAEFAAGEGADVETGGTEFCVGVFIFFYRKETVVAEGQDVAG